MSTDVAVVRERWVTESELSNYEYLSDDYQLTVIGSKGTSYSGELGYRQLYSPGSLPTEGLMRAAQVATNALFGSSSYMYGLTNELADYDIAHVAETFHGFSEQAIAAKRKHGCSVVCTVWENIPFFSEDGHYSRVYRERLKQRDTVARKAKVRDAVDEFIAVTERARFALEAEGVPSEKITVVPIGVDADRFHPDALEESDRRPEGLGLETDTDTVNVVFVGRYPWFKGPYDLLSAWKVVEERVNRPVHLTMVGTGDHESLQSYAEHVGVESASVRGPIPYEQVPLLFAGADISVTPSIPVRYWQEQYGRVIVEAQAAGTPVVASAVGGIPDAVGDPGVLVNPGDAYDLANELIALIENDERRQRLGRESRERIESKLTLEHVSEQVEAVYDSVDSS